MAGNGSGYAATKWAWELSEVGPIEKFVLLCIAGRCDQAYSCWPSYALICKETGLSRSTVMRAVGSLEEGGLLLRATVKRKNGSTSSNRYFLSHPDAPHMTGDLDEEDDAETIERLAQAASRVTGVSQ